MNSSRIIQGWDRKYGKQLDSFRDAEWKYCTLTERGPGECERLRLPRSERSACICSFTLTNIHSGMQNPRHSCIINVGLSLSEMSLKNKVHLFSTISQPKGKLTELHILQYLEHFSTCHSCHTVPTSITAALFYE